MFMYVLLIIGLAVVSAVIGVSLRNRQLARRGEAMRQAAQFLGIQYLEGEAAYAHTQQERTDEGFSPQPMPETLERLVRKLSTPRLTGLFRGIRVTVYEEQHTSHNGTHTESRFKAYFAAPLPFELALSKEGAAARITKAFGGQDVTIGDAAFDAAVRVKTSTPDAAVHYLQDADRRKAVLAALQSYPSTVVCRTHVVVSRQGRLKGSEEIKAVLAAIVPVATAFSE